MKIILKTLVLVVFILGCHKHAENVNTGMYYYSKGEYAKAKNQFLKAQGKSTGHFSEKEFHTILGNTYMELNQLDSAKIWHLRSLAIDQNYSEALINLGVVHRKSGEFQEALKCYKRANIINPENAELHTSLGSLYLHLNKPKLAAKHLRKAIRLNNRLVLAHSNYALALAHLGEFEKSEQELRLAESMGYSNGYLIRKKIQELNSVSN